MPARRLPTDQPTFVTADLSARRWQPGSTGRHAVALACWAALAAAPLPFIPGLAKAQSAPVAATTSRSNTAAPTPSSTTVGSTPEAAQVMHALREQQVFAGVWQPTALRPPEDFRNLQRDVESQRIRAAQALLQGARLDLPDQAAARQAQSALNALVKGDMAPALEWLQLREADALPRNRKVAAEWARHQGALLAAQDVQKSLEAYQRAKTLEGGPHVATQLVISDLNTYLQASVPTGGLASPGLDNVKGNPLAALGDDGVAGRQRLEARLAEGNARLQSRDVTAALDAFQDALRTGEDLLSRPMVDKVSQAALQRDLSIVHNRIGDALQLQGQTADALNAYQHSLSLREKLAAGPKASPQSLHDLVQSQTRLGDLLTRRGQARDALVLLDKAAATAQRLAKASPDHADTQRQLATSLERQGDARMQGGKAAAAKSALTQAVDIRQTLLKKDTSNRLWQRELANGVELLSEVLQAGKEHAAALSAARKGLALRTELLAADPDNIIALRDLSVGHNRMGDVLAAQGDREGAVKAFRTALGLREDLVQREPTHLPTQRDLTVTQTKLADVLALQGDQTGALAALRAALSVREQLVAQDSRNLQWQGDLALVLGKLSAISQLPIQERQTYLERGQAIVDRLKSEGRLGAQQNWVAWFDAQRRLLSRPVVERTVGTAITVTAPTSR